MTKLPNSFGASLCFVLGACTWGCSTSSKTGTSNPMDASSGPGFNQAAADELRAKHVDKYIGKAPLTNTSVNADGDTVYSFVGGDAALASDGPICYLGAPYDVVVHDAHSDNLLIFLEGGGACWSTLCSATTTAGTAIPKSGILAEDPPNNPVGDWNIVFAPYCDGSVFAGDNDMIGTGGAHWHFRGLANLTAAVDVAKKVFPNPKRILLAGSSAGGYGTLTGTGVTRLEYPNTELDVFNDAGLGLSNPNDPSMLATVKQDWKFDQFIPDSCTECQTGQETAIIGWGLQADPTLRISGFSSYGDAVIGGVFLGLQPADFKPLLLSETSKVHDQFPTRFERFFIDGTQHTVLQTPNGMGVGYGDAVDGISVEQWLTKMLARDAGWTDHLQGMDGG